MNIELIGWIAAFIVVWEGFFILLVKKKAFENFDGEVSILTSKFMSLFLAAMFLLMQYFIVGIGSGFLNSDVMINPNPIYFNLVWELLIVGGLFIFYKLNEKLAEFL